MSGGKNEWQRVEAWSGNGQWWRHGAATDKVSDKGSEWQRALSGSGHSTATGSEWQQAV
jgi:hypothetical protein